MCVCVCVCIYIYNESKIIGYKINVYNSNQLKRLRIIIVIIIP